MLIFTYEIRFHKLSFAFSKHVSGVNTVKNGGGAKMVVVFTITEINCLVVSLFNDLVRPPFVIIFVVLSALAPLLALIRP